MDIVGLMNLSLEVLKDWRVICIAVAMIIAISLGNYVVKYRKRPPSPKKVRAAVAAPAPAPAPEETEEAEE